MKHRERRKQTEHSGKRSNNIEFFLLALPGILLLLVFCYVPMAGIIIAFKDFKVNLGIFGSPWNGLDNFKFFFTSSDAWRVIRNTLGLNFLFIVMSTICAVLFALLIFRIRSKRAIKIYQTAALMPSFLSWVVIGYIAYAFLETKGGMVNSLLEWFGVDPVNWYNAPGKWPVILVIINLWHGVGYGSLFYFASLVGISQDYFEAAALDGATKMQEFRYIILPSLVPLITIMTILNIGKIFRADFGLFFNVTRSVGALYSTTDVIDTYVYRSLMNMGNIGMSAAVGLFQSVVGFVLILGTNLIVNKFEPDNALF